MHVLAEAKPRKVSWRIEESPRECQLGGGNNPLFPDAIPDSWLEWGHHSQDFLCNGRKVREHL